MNPKLIRVSTVALSLNLLLRGQLSFLQKHYNVIAVSGHDEDLREVEKREGVAVQNIIMQRHIAPFKDVISLIKLYFYFKKEKPQIVHSITPKAGLLSMIAAKYAGVPIRMHTFTGLIFPSKKGILKQILIIMDKVLCFHATNIYAEGSGVQNDLLRYEITNKPLKILAKGNINGVNLDYFDTSHFSEQQNILLKEKLKINLDDFVFIFVGRLVADKGINELIEAFKIINSAFSNTKLLLVGFLEPELDALLPKTLNEIAQNTAIISVGYQNDVRPYFAIANTLVFPSYREGFPNVVLQAGAMGLPSIVSDINGCNEIIIDNQNGIIIPVKNTAAIINAMKEIIENKVLYNQLKKNSRKRIVENYEQKVVWDAILQEYQSLEKDV